MIAYIEGKLIEKTPTYAIIDCSGVGYFLNISLNTFSKIADAEKCKLLTVQIIREDAHLLFGFINEEERYFFKQLISVSGVGANTARMILSSLTPKEIHSAILSNDINLLKSIKGIGTKTAERIVVDLKDKLGKTEVFSNIPIHADNINKEEAISALVMLGFSKNAVEKVVNSIIKENEKDISIENIIKLSLKRL